jgi:hypothetical protein
MKVKEMSLEDSQLVVQSLLLQLREAQSVAENKTKQVRNLTEDLDKAHHDEALTQNALKKILQPLVEERAALYLIHEDEVVRRLAKEILNADSDDDPSEYGLKGSYMKSRYNR